MTSAFFILLIACMTGLIAFLLIPGGDRYGGNPVLQTHESPNNAGDVTAPDRIGQGYSVAKKVGKKKVAILIDDIGYDPEALRRLLAIEAPMAFSVLPHTPHARSSAIAIHRAGREVLLHLPMEPHGYPERDPGRGALFTSMTTREIRRTLEENLEFVPHATGANNHMGSKFMEAQDALRDVFDTLHRRGLYFVDSLTTESSVARDVAAEKILRFSQRDLFIDDAGDRQWARIRLEKLLDLREQWDDLLLIGHPYPETVSALEEMIPRLSSRGIQIVPLSVLIDGREGLWSERLKKKLNRNGMP